MSITNISKHAEIEVQLDEKNLKELIHDKYLYIASKEENLTIRILYDLSPEKKSVVEKLKKLQKSKDASKKKSVKK